MGEYVAAIDEGTTGVRVLVFDRGSRLTGGAYKEIDTRFPRNGWVEQDPIGIWQATRAVFAEALSQAGVAPSQLAAVGVTNQRATTLVWERATGQPVYPAIGWQDVRTAERASALMAEGIFANTLVSSAKIDWVLDHVDGARTRSDAGELCLGTVDSWLLWCLSGGRVHLTDASNASCTGLYDHATGEWDLRVTDHLGLNLRLLPAICSSSDKCATSDPEVLGAAVPLSGVAGDQQAAMFGELGTEPGAVKITYGTSAMLDVNTGELPVLSLRGVFPLVLWQLDGKRSFCLEGTVMTAGAAVQWLRDGLGIIEAPEQACELAASVPDSGGVWAVPAFQGLGTPHMDPQGRAVLGGLSRGTTRAHVVRAVLEGIAFRTREVLETLLEDARTPRPETLRVDGGAAANDFLLQFLADVLGQPVERPETVQASALGAAYLAGLAVGFWSGIDEVRHAWRSGGVFEPRCTADERDTRFHAWQRTVAAARLPGGGIC